MTHSSNRMFDEFAKLMNDAAGVAQGAKREFDTMLKTQAERFIADMDLVRRDDFDVLREMVIKTREENLMLTERVAALEEQLAATRKPAAKTARAETASTRSSGKTSG